MLNKQEKSDVKIFFCYENIIIFVLGYFFLITMYTIRACNVSITDHFTT